MSQSNRYRRLFVAPLAGVERRGRGTLGSGGLAVGIPDSLPSGSHLIQGSHPFSGILSQLDQGQGSGRRGSVSAGQGCDRNGSPSLSGLLQPVVCGNESFGSVDAGHRPFHSELEDSADILQDGDTSICSSFGSSGRLDGVSGKDVYLQVLMHPDSRKFLRFMVGGKVYQFKVLCFGLSTAPQVFTRVMAPVSAILHRMGLRLRRYLDDWLLQVSSREQVLLALRTVLRLCRSLGIVIPTQQMVFLGVILDSTTFRASPALKRVEKLLSIGDVFLSCVSQPASSWLELLGVLSSLIQLVPGGRLRMRSLQLALRRQWDHVDQSQLVEWSQEIRQDLSWWLDRDCLELSISLEQVSPQLELWSDASDVGWGAHLDEQVASGLRVPEEVELSINARELLAIERALLWFGPHLVGSSVAVFADNSTAISYLRNQGGTRSSFLNSIAQRILRWAESLPLVVSSQFIMGKHNVLADALSRPNQILGSEWTLKQEVFRDLCKRWPVSIDLFATSQNHRCSIYFSPYHDHNALGINVLLQNWNEWQAYAFPPWSLILAVLKKLRSSSGVLLTIIALYWPQRPWFPYLLDLVVDGPVALPQSRDLLRQPHFHRFHLGVSRLSLLAWRLSSDSPVPVDSPDM